MDVLSHMTVVDESGRAEAWPMTCELGEAGYELAVQQPGGPRWVGAGELVTVALDELREKLAPLGYRLCCNGCRVDAHTSGMLADLGRGLWVHLLEGVEPGERPPVVSTLDFAAPELMTTREAQDAWYQQWLTRPAVRPRSPSTLFGKGGRRVRLWRFIVPAVVFALVLWLTTLVFLGRGDGWTHESFDLQGHTVESRIRFADDLSYDLCLRLSKAADRRDFGAWQCFEGRSADERIRSGGLVSGPDATVAWVDSDWGFRQPFSDLSYILGTDPYGYVQLARFLLIPARVDTYCVNMRIALHDGEDVVQLRTTTQSLPTFEQPVVANAAHC